MNSFIDSVSYMNDVCRERNELWFRTILISQICSDRWRIMRHDCEFDIILLIQHIDYLRYFITVNNTTSYYTSLSGIHYYQ